MNGMTLTPKSVSSRAQPIYHIDDLYNFLPSLDTAHKEKLTRPFNTPTQYEAVVNDRTNGAVCTVSENYNIIQHQNAFRSVLDGLKFQDIDARGVIHNYGDVVTLELLFDNMVNANDNQPITMGCQFTNSFNTSTGFRGGAYAWRQVCSNGMHAMKLLKDTNIYFKHIGEVELRMERAIAAFMHNLSRNENVLINIINKAIEIPVRFTDMDEKIRTIAHYVGSTKQAKAIVESTGLPNDTTVYSIYNAITDYASHSTISYSMLNNLQSTAQSILSSSDKFAVIPAPVEVS